MKSKNLIFFLVALILLVGCSGEGYVKVINDSLSSILVSVNNNADEVVAAGDTSNTYTVSLVKGVVNNIPVDATGEWVGNYSGTASLTDGETVYHYIGAQVADLTLVNLSVDSAECDIEGYDTEYFVGEDSVHAKYTVDGGVDVSYYGRYMFLNEENLAWMPGETYRYAMIPDACEIQLNNLHPTWTIYYVYLSPSTSETWNDDDQLGDDLIESGFGYIWKADGDIGWDIQVQAGDPHPDSALYVYEYYDTGVCTSDHTWIYEFPAIFSAASVGKIAKADADNMSRMKTNALNKVYDIDSEPARIEKIKKVDAGKAGLMALRK